MVRGRRTSQAGDRQRGAALVEAALVSPIVFALIFGIFEFSMLFRSHLTTSNMAQMGARAAAAYGRDPLADKLIIEAILQAGSALDDDEIEWIAIYRAESPNDPPQASCKNGNANAGVWACNVYRPSDWNNDTLWQDSNFGCSGTSLDKWYCPADRETLSTDLGYIGVYVKTRHSQATGLFGTIVNLDEQAVVRFEPEPPESGP
jgi:hypothetical protein